MPINKNLWLTKITSELHNNSYDTSMMLSYWYHKNINIDEVLSYHFNKPYPDIIIDSGAFTAMTKGVEISLDDYQNWLVINNIKKYINLDVIGNDELTYKNQIDMEKNGFNPIPVFHNGSDKKYLKLYLSKEYKTIALGALVKLSLKTSDNFIKSCFKIDNNKRFHGLGVGNWHLIKKYNWQSVDSSSYGASFRFGNKIEFLDGKFYKTKDKNNTSKEKLAKQSILAWCKAIKWRNQNIKNFTIDKDLYDLLGV